MATQIISRLTAAAATAVLLAAFPAFADEVDDSILRAETQFAMLDQADAAAVSREDYELARLRLQEARAANRSRNNDAAMDRAEEASLLAQLVQERIKLSALTKSQRDLQDSLAVLSRETNR